MGKLYGTVTLSVVLFSAALGFFAAAAWDSWWVWAVVGSGLLLAFLALAGSIPRARQFVPKQDAPSAGALLQAFGALCVLEVLLLGFVLWAWGNRDHSSSNAYQVLGLLIFLALLGVGAQGAVITLVRFFQFRATVHNQRRAERLGTASPVHH